MCDKLGDQEKKNEPIEIEIPKEELKDKEEPLLDMEPVDEPLEQQVKKPTHREVLHKELDDTLTQTLLDLRTEANETFDASWGTLRVPDQSEKKLDESLEEKPQKSGLREKSRCKKITTQRLEDEKNLLKSMRAGSMPDEDLVEVRRIRESRWGKKNLMDKKTGSKEKLTNEQIYKQVSEGDYTNFEHLDVLLRNELAALWMRRKFSPEDGETPQEYVARLHREGGVSALMNPLFRLGVSLAMRGGGLGNIPVKYMQQIDEACGTMIMRETLKTRGTQADKDAYKESLRAEYGDAHDDEWYERKTNKAFERERMNRQFIAKNLLLTHMGSFKEIEKGESITNWTGDVSSAFTHCSRVAFIMPAVEKEVKDKDKSKDKDKDKNKDEDKEEKERRRKIQKNSKENHDRMWRFITHTGEQTTLKKRGASTHDLQRRQLNKGKPFKEKKVLFNLTEQYGVNVAIGGLGKEGIPGLRGKKRILKNDGSCGHIYTMHKEGEVGINGAMLIGFESDAHKKTNQLGHTHGLGNGEFASSFGGQRTDEIGDKYGGREVDLSHLTAEEIANAMLVLEEFIAVFGAPDASDEQIAIYEKLMDILTGPPMGKENFRQLNELLSRHMRDYVLELLDKPDELHRDTESLESELLDKSSSLLKDNEDDDAFIIDFELFESELEKIFAQNEDKLSLLQDSDDEDEEEIEEKKEQTKEQKIIEDKEQEKPD